MHRHIVLGLPAFAVILGAAATSRAADIPGGKTTRATLPVSGTYTPGKFETRGDSDWYRVTLEAGADYAVSSNGSFGLVEYKETNNPFSGNTGVYLARIMSDCRADATTQCVLKPGKAQKRQTAWFQDVDWFRADLQKGRTYGVAVSAVTPFTAILDAKGRVLAEGQTGINGFKPAKTGPYFVRVRTGDDDGANYEVLLTRK